LINDDIHLRRITITSTITPTLPSSRATGPPRVPRRGPRRKTISRRFPSRYRKIRPSRRLSIIQARPRSIRRYPRAKESRTLIRRMVPRAIRRCPRMKGSRTLIRRMVSQARRQMQITTIRVNPAKKRLEPEQLLRPR